MPAQYYIDGGTNGLNGQGADSIYWSVRRHDEQSDFMVANKKISTEYNTNNQAEYAALIDVLNFIHPQNTPIGEVVITSDSQLLVRQMAREWRIKDQTLKQLHGIAETLLGELRLQGYTINLTWSPRRVLVEQLGH